MPQITLEESAALLRASVEEIGKSFTEPDDDWLPVCTFQPDEGQNVMMAIDPRFLDTTETKQRLVDEVIKPTITGVGAKTVGMVMSVWMLNFDKDELPKDGDLPRPSESPDRIEAVIVFTWDSLNTAVWVAKIDRFENAPPTLKDWENWKGSMELQGIFIDGMQDLIRDNGGKSDDEFLTRLQEITINMNEVTDEQMDEMFGSEE